MTDVATTQGGDTGIKFGEPPAKSHNYEWDKIAKRLRRNPEKWLLVFEGDRLSLVTAIRLGSIRVLSPDKGFEVQTANNKRPEGGTRTCDLWLRYNPEKDKEK